MKMIDTRGKDDLRYCSVDFRPLYEGEVPGKKTMTEQVYIPLKEQVEEMLAAGERLEAYRRELYHYGPEDEIDEVEDPGDAYAMDPAEMSMIQMRLLAKRDRLLKAQAAIDKKAKDEADQLKLELVEPAPEAPESPK